jgi:hypothetical protein
MDSLFLGQARARRQINLGGSSQSQTGGHRDLVQQARHQRLQREQDRARAKAASTIQVHPSLSSGPVVDEDDDDTLPTRTVAPADTLTHAHRHSTEAGSRQLNPGTTSKPNTTASSPSATTTPPSKTLSPRPDSSPSADSTGSGTRTTSKDSQCGAESLSNLPQQTPAGQSRYRDDDDRRHSSLLRLRRARAGPS